jgi:hypothetical protein
LTHLRNIKKCHFSVQTTIKSTREPVYTINDEKLERVESIKDLGVIINYNMSFHVHIANIVNNAYKRLGFAMRNSKHVNDAYALSFLFNGIVRSKLEYASIIWSPVHSALGGAGWHSVSFRKAPKPSLCLFNSHKMIPPPFFSRVEAILLFSLAV